ncbi:hypothetical protein J3E68DRAFT_401051 [Trichoderma sp. SZMC 28012]
MSNGGFVFIQEEGTGSHKPVTKSLIKMHVMDRVVMQRRALKQEHRDDDADATEGDQAPSLEHHISQNDLRSLAGIDNMLRLSGLSIEVNTQTRFLLHHFLNYRSKTLCTVTAETGWLKYAINDNALFSTTLYHWASINYSALPPKYQSSQHLLRLKAAAIQTLASRLQPTTGGANGNTEMVSDAVIATVACLANINLMYGDLDEAEIHFQGLKALIRGCNGVLHLGFEGLVARIVRWTDSCHSQLSNQELSFDETSPSSEFVHPKIPLPDAQKFHIQPHKLAIIHELRLIARELITNPKDNMAPDSRVALGFRLLASDRSILKHVHGVNDCSVLALVARAALLYSHTVLRGASRSSRIISTSIDQLKQLIVSAFVSKGDIFASHPIALVWVLLVGVVASGRENIQGTWFRLCLEKACGSDSKLSWEKVQATIDAPNNISPQPFYWMIEEIPLHLPCINSAILC